MRITARFDSVDAAEFAAAAVRHRPDVFDAAVREVSTERRNDNIRPLGFYTNMSTGAASGLPLPVFESHDDVSYVPIKKASVDIICRMSAASQVAAALRNHGGHDIRER